MNMDVDDVTDCSADFSDCWNGNGCAKAFCDMDNDLYDARGDSSLHPNGVLAAANLYRNYVNHEGDPVPMDMMIDDQARAFFDIVLGATWLFTGSGSFCYIHQKNVITFLKSSCVSTNLSIS